MESYDNDINYINIPAERIERDLGIKTREQLVMLGIHQVLSFVGARFIVSNWQEGGHH